MSCASCGHTNPETARFCGQCGSALAREAPCPSCGAPNPAEQRFCQQCGHAMAGPTSSAEDAAHETVASFAEGRYQVLRYLGEGSKKTVYLARDGRLGREVAIGAVRTRGLGSAGVERIRREARAMARLGDHPHIVPVHDVVEEAGRLLLITPYMAGGDVEALLARSEGGRLPPARAFEIADQVCQALDHAHRRGIVHRDVKPGNVWLSEDGRAKLGDFGLATSLAGSRLTLESGMVGTVAYMPPEQALGRPPDARSDLYALGATLYEMLTGRPPFLGDGVVAIVSQHIHSAPVAPSWVNADLPPAVDTLVLRLLAKDPAQRPPSAEAVREELHRLREAPAPPSVPGSPALANPLDRLAGGVFVGRDPEIDALRLALDEARAGRGQVRLLVGEPGIGKTRTTEELGTYAALRGVRTFWGRCHEGQGAPAYWPWVQILRECIAEREPAALAKAMGAGAVDIAAIVPELRERLPDLGAPPSLEGDSARFRLFDGVTTFLRALSRSEPLLLVLDDLHWADEPSLLLLRFLVHEMRQSRICLVATYRDVELKRQHPLAETLAGLSGEGLVERVLLRGLAQGDVARFVQMTSGKKPPFSLVEAIYRESEGNPFVVHEMVRLLVKEGRLDDAESVTSWSLSIPQGVRDVIGRRLNQLSEPCNEALRVASVIGREFDASVLARVAELEAGLLRAAVEEGVAERIVTEAGEGRYRFSHALVRETLYEELSTPQRVRLHRAVGEALEEAYGPDDAERSAELAHHFFQAIQTGTVERAVRYARRAAERAVELHAYEEAAEHFERAYQSCEMSEPCNEAERCELSLGRGDAQRRAGRPEDAARSFARAAELADRTGRADLFAQAAIGHAKVALFGRTDAGSIELLETALRKLGREDSALRARALGLLQLVRPVETPAQVRRAETAEALAIARRVGDESTLMHVLDDLCLVADPRDPPERRVEMAGEMLALAERLGDLEGRTAAHLHRVAARCELGRFDEAERDAEEVGRAARELRQPVRMAIALRTSAGLALVRGHFADAEKRIDEADEIVRRVQGNVVALRVSTLQRTVLLLLRGEPEAAMELLASQIRVDPEPGAQTLYALACAEAGREAEARAEVARALDSDFGGFDDFRMLFRLCALALVAVRLEDRRLATVLYERLLPFRDRFAPIFFAANGGSVAAYLGMLASMRGRWSDAEAHFEEAVARNERAGARPFLALTRLSWARMCLRRDVPGDAERALALANLCLDTAEAIGMKATVDEALAIKVQAQGVGPGTDLRTSIDDITAALESRRPDLRPHAAPDGTVTLMFSDMEGFTAMTDRLGDQAALRVIRTHHAIVREAVREHGGYEVELRGDGFLLAFSSARRAIDCGIAIQRRLAEYSAEHPEQPIRVRMGLHTGEALVDADKFFGKTVILASRIADQAAAGQILVSSLLKQLVESAGDLRFEGERELDLKGFSEPHRAYAVSWQL